LDRLKQEQEEESVESAQSADKISETLIPDNVYCLIFDSPLKKRAAKPFSYSMRRNDRK
jgi:hypothetical protein